MDRKRTDAAALVLGTLATLTTMAMHPRGGSGEALREGESLSRVGVAAVASHSIAIAGIPLLLMGLWGLSRRLGWDSAPVRLAFAAYGLASAAVLNAAVMSGFVATGTAMSIRSDSPEGAKTVAAYFAYTFVLNQSFAKVYVVASSAAIVLWSLRAIRLGSGWRGAGIFGVAAGTAASALVITRTLPLNVHGFGVIVLLQSAWTLWMAALLSRGDPTALTLQAP
ncbi:MAG TPA: hypothetical protein VGH97_10440 [Thermoanaerobaculia bacterium]